jgi:serine protease Do
MRMMTNKFEFSRVIYRHGMMAVLATLVLVWAAAAEAKTAPESFADLAEKLLPSVVNISTTQVIEGREGPQMPQLPPGSPFEDFFKEFFDRNQPQQRSRRATSLGSGFIISNDGYVVTNNHVIADADEISVILQDDTRLKAELIGRDPKTDLAVLKVKSDTKLPAVDFGNSNKSRVGDWVVAIGNPFGLGGTVTAGIISARGRDINAGPYDDFFQTDASINRGNSGGPMFNLKGEVIGINTAIFSPSGGSVGIGFAIPSSTAEPVIKQLIKSGRVKRGWLGVHIQAVTEEIAETLGLKKAEGALVASVIEDSPAAKAGIKSGDVILEFDDKPVREMRSLPRIVAETEVDKPVKMEIWRDGDDKTLSVSVGELKEDAKVAKRGSSGGSSPTGELRIEELELTLAAITEKTRERFKLKKDAKGVVVTKVDAEGPAGQKEIRPGDVIIEVSQKEVVAPVEVRERISNAKKAGRKSVLLHLEGQNGLRFVAVRITKK